MPPLDEHASHLEAEPLLPLPPHCEEAPERPPHLCVLATRCILSGFTSTPALEDPPEEPPELWPPEAATRGINSGDTVTPALLEAPQFPPQRPHFGALMIPLDLRADALFGRGEGLGPAPPDLDVLQFGEGFPPDRATRDVSK